MTNSFYKCVLLTPTLELIIYVSELRVGSDGWAIKPPKGYRIRRDKPAPTHSDSQRHYHIYANGQVAVINQDGTLSHHTAQDVIDNLPEDVKNFLSDECHIPLSKAVLGSQNLLIGVHIIKTYWIVQK